jgi:hypothetical protein
MSGKLISSMLLCLGIFGAGSAAAEHTPEHTTTATAPAAQSLTPILAKSWARFQSTMDETRIKMENTPRFIDNPQNRARAYYTLMEAQAMAYNFAVAPKTGWPRIQVNTGWQTHFYTLGQNGMDFYYGVLMVDGRQTYRMRGRMGDIRMLLMQVMNMLPGKSEAKTVGNHDFKDFVIGKDGSVDVILSATKHEGNWVPLDPTSDFQFILMRRMMGDWNDDPGDWRVELISKPDDSYFEGPDFDEAATAARIDRATDFARYCIEVWNIGLYDMYLKGAGGVKNVMGLLPGVVTSEVGNPASNYAMTIWELNEDEALIVELKEPPKTAAYWSFQLGDVWSRSLDFAHYQTDINFHHARMDDDGVFRAVVSARDPGYANWLDNRGRNEGTLVFRNYRSMTAPVPTTRKVKFSEIEAAMHGSSAKITAEQRAADLAHRREGFLKLHGE